METKLTQTMSNDQNGTKMVNTIDTYVGMCNDNFHKTWSNLPDLLQGGWNNAQDRTEEEDARHSTPEEAQTRTLD